MQKYMRVTLIQSTVHWEDPAANRAMFAQKLENVTEQTDLVVLPEMFSTGFSMNAEKLAEPMNGATVVWMQQAASRLNAAVTGSFICKEGARFFNRLLFVRPDGSMEQYDKKHLFTLAGEHNHFTAGQKRITVEWRGFRICPLICYDLRFPVWSRNARGSFIKGLHPYYDVLLYVANWPNRRAHHWRALLTARAIENQSYVVGVNIAGADGNGLEYTGDSAVLDFSGQRLLEIADGKEAIQTVELSLEALHAYRAQLPFLADGDVFEFRG
ncbi:MAG: amidohydrolase [Saprospiraceae bacterium]|nr:amidohydrolase [Saprospiraceae bacterium]